MGNLYKKVLELGTKGTSTMAAMKRALDDKNANIEVDDILGTLPKEIDSIKTIAATANNICLSKKQLPISGAGIDKCIYNEKSGIFVAVIDNAQTYVVINTNTHYHNNQYLRQLSLPGNADGNVSYNNFIGTDVTSLIAINEYIFMRFSGTNNNGEPLWYYTKDGAVWSRDFSKIISGAREDVIDIIASFPWGMIVQAKYGQFIYDFITNTVRPVDRTINIPYKNLKTIVMDNFGILVHGTNMDYDTDNLYYVTLEDNFNIKKLVIGSELATITNSFAGFMKTGRNTIHTLTRVGSGYAVYELYLSIDKTGALNITHRNVDVNKIMNRNNLRKANSCLHNYTCRVGKYIFTSFDTTSIVYSDDEVNWHSAVSIPDTSKTIIAMFYDGTYLHVIDSGIQDNIFAITMIDSEDVPMYKVYLNPEGKLCNGEVGNTYNSLYSVGRICNMMIESTALFDNKVIFDPRYHHISFNQIIYYIDAYYYIIGYQKHIMLLKSFDGFKWEKVYETTESPIVFSVSNYNRWRLEIIRGRLYLIQNGSGVNAYGPIRIDFTDSGVELNVDKSICWGITSRLQDTTLRYLYQACNGVVYANVEDYYSDKVTDIRIADEFGYRVLSDEPITAYAYLEIRNRDDAAVIVTHDNFIYCADEKIYRSKIYGIDSIDPSSTQIFEYDDEALVILQNTGINPVPFIKFFRINKADMSIDAIQYSNLPVELPLYDRRPYLPVGTIKDNLFFVTDYNNREPGLFFDLENNFKIVKFEDNTKIHTQSSMQYCNDRMFVIDSYDKVYSSYSSELMQDHNWYDIAGNDNGFYAITDGGATGDVLWYSHDGLAYVAVDKMIEGYKPRYISAAMMTVMTATDEYTDEVVVLSDLFENRNPKSVKIPMKLYIQNVKVQNTPLGIQGFVFGKINENDPYNIIYTTYDFETWTEIGITTVSNPTIKTMWRDITCNKDDVWAAISTNSTEVITSTDGITWQNTTMPYDIAWDAIVATDTMFVAVARNDNRAAYSYDGVIWEPYELPKVAEWCGVSYGMVNGVGTLCIIAANTNTVLTGPDIFNLEEHDTIDNLDYVRLVYQDNKFVAIARNSRYGAYSFDGINWELSLLPHKADWRYLLYASGAFVVIDSTATTMISSINGMSWINEEIIPGRTYRLIDYHNDKFIIFEFTGGEEIDESETSNDNNTVYDDYSFKYVGTSDTMKEWIDCIVRDYNLVIGSKDGIVVSKMGKDSNWIDSTLPLTDSELEYDWLKITSPLQENWSGIISHNNVKVMFSNETDLFMQSNDYGDSWIRKEFPINGTWSTGVFGLNTLAVFSDNQAEYMYSIDYGENWRVKSSGIIDAFANALYQNGTIYLFSKDKSKYYTTTDLETWIDHDIDMPICKAVYTGTLYVGISTGRRDYLVSENGMDWTVKSLPNELDVADIAYGDNKVLITTRNSNIVLLSTDNTETWTEIVLPETNTRWYPYYLNNRFVLLGQDTNLNLVSTDGRSWSVGQLFMKGDWKIAYNDFNEHSINRIYAVCQEHSEIAYSYDGKFWYRSSTMSDVLYGNGLYVTVDKSAENGNEAVIFYSKDCVEWFVSKVPLNGKMTDICFGDGRFVIITDALDNYIYESIDVVEWTIRYLNLDSIKLKIAHNHIGFAILTDGKTVQIAENRIRFVNTALSGSMNQVIGETNGTVVILDYSTYTPYIGSKGSSNFTKLDEIEIDNTRNWNISSTESSIFIYSDMNMWIYNSYRNKWHYLEYDIPNIVGIQEVVITLDNTIQRVDVLLAGDKIYFITGLYTVSEDIMINDSIGYDLTTNISDPIIGICPAATNKSIKVFTESEIYDLVRFTSDGSYEMISAQMLNLDCTIKDIAYANGKFIIMTDSNKYLVSEDGDQWKENCILEGANGLSIESGTDFFIGSYRLNEKIYYFYTSDGEEITYYDFEETYGTDIDVTVTPGSIFIAKEDSVLTELMFYDKTIMMSCSGSAKSKYARINPKKNRFAKGDFVTNTNGAYTKVCLDFTPRIVIIRSRTEKATDTFEEFVISKTSEIYQNIDKNIENSLSRIKIVKDTEGVDIDRFDTGAIVLDGFMINNIGLKNTSYIYYAFN